MVRCELFDTGTDDNNNLKSDGKLVTLAPLCTAPRWNVGWNWNWFKDDDDDGWIDDDETDNNDNDDVDDTFLSNCDCHSITARSKLRAINWCCSSGITAKIWNIEDELVEDEEFVNLIICNTININNNKLIVQLDVDGTTFLVYFVVVEAWSCSCNCSCSWAMISVGS